MLGVGWDLVVEEWKVAELNGKMLIMGRNWQKRGQIGLMRDGKWVLGSG